MDLQFLHVDKTVNGMKMFQTVVSKSNLYVCIYIQYRYVPFPSKKLTGYASICIYKLD